MSSREPHWRAVDAFSAATPADPLLESMSEALRGAAFPIRRFETEDGLRALVVEAAHLVAPHLAAPHPDAPHPDAADPAETYRLEVAGLAAEELASTTVVLLSRAGRATDAGAGLAELLDRRGDGVLIGAATDLSSSLEPAASLAVAGEGVVQLWRLSTLLAAPRAKPSITPLGLKLGEHPEGLEKRSDWFGKRHG